MHGIFFDIGLGAGLGAACGFRPFLPLLLAGALASAGALGRLLRPGPFAFLEEDWWLLVVVVTLVLAYAAQLVLGLAPHARPPRARRARADPLAASLAGLGPRRRSGDVRGHPGRPPRRLVAGADRRHRARPPWPSGWSPRSSSAPARGCADRGAREALSVYLDAASLLAAALVALLHPLGYVLSALLAWMLLRTRSRAAEKYAGLRILRR